MDDLLNRLYTDDAQEAAYFGLFALMTGISEEYYCAGWMMGLEYSLWQVEAGTPYGKDNITERQAILLRLLAEEAGGWWAWPEGADRPKFYSTEAWLEHLKLHG